ncbi:MAG: Zn-ribbon domain-containing OB-fold protein [Anaerolineae bacterium]|nr:Zn-ribbon domain-containing OB-fold protein [Anaerolineae bacterium]
MDISAYWRTRKQRLSLTGEICPHCGAKLFPPRDICPHCGKPARTPYHFSGRGTVYSFSIVYNPPEGFEPFVPYVVALVKLEEGSLITAQLTDVEPECVYIGMPVEMVTRKMREEDEDGLVIYNYKFRPVLQPTSL